MPAQLTLDQLIEEACQQFAPADAPTRYYTAAIPHANAFRRELIAGTGRELRTAYLELGQDRCADLPDDYVEYTMLGLQLPGWGTVRNLIYNGSLSKATAPHATRQDTQDFLTPPTTYECEQARHGLLDDGYDGYCGFGYPGFSQEFRIDREEGRIICNSRVPADALLVLEYYGFGAKDGEDIAIDPLAHSWGINYILWKLHLQKQNLAMARELERLTLTEKTKYTNRTRNFSLAGATQAKQQASAQRWK